jgi:hypothetical protein
LAASRAQLRLSAQLTFDAFAGLADTFPFEEPAKPEAGQFDRARTVAGQLRSGTVGHNAFRTDFSVSFGYKQSGIGREGVHEGLPHFLETKFVVLEGRPAGYEDTVL